MEADGDGPVGVVGGDGRTVDALADRGVGTVAGAPGEVLDRDPRLLVAVGTADLLALACERPSVPVLPVAADAGVRSVPRASLDAALDRLVAGDWETEPHPLVGVSFRGREPELALFDAMVVTAEPAHISEYTVAVDGEQVARFRADGVVAATPAGTAGYARAAGAPVAPPGVDVLAVEPVAPFATNLDHWTVPVSSVTITVERDEATVEVLADDRTVGTAPLGEPVTLDRAGTVRTVRVPEGRSPFGAGAELEKL